MSSTTFLIDASSTGGNNPLIQVTITENAGGTVTFSMTQLVAAGNYLGDLRGLFFDLANESLLGSLSVSNASKTLADGAVVAVAQPAWASGNDSIKSVGSNSNNMDGLLGSDGGYDFGIEIGSQGVGKNGDDVRAFSFTLGSSARALTLADFSQVDFGARVMSVGRDIDGNGTIDTSRDDSSKVGGTSPGVETNHAPTDIALSNSSVSENSPNGTIVGALSAADPDVGDHFTFTLLDDAGGLFAIDGTNLVVAGPLDYETATSHSVTIRVSDAANATYDETFTIAVDNVSGFIVGTNGNDMLFGTSEEDTIQGLAGNDRLIGGAGPDILDGGPGNDTADYRNSPVGLTVDLLNPGNNTGEAIGDTYISIERLRGSAFNDVLRGDDNNNFLDGGAGADILDGRDGNDYAWYDSSPVGVTVSLANPAINTGDAVGDTYISIKNLAGSNFNDTLIGDGQNNFLRGQAGADVLNGGPGGFDTADYFNSTVGLTVDLLNPVNNTGDARATATSRS